MLNAFLLRPHSNHEFIRELWITYDVINASNINPSNAITIAWHPAIPEKKSFNAWVALIVNSVNDAKKSEENNIYETAEENNTYETY